MFAKFCLFFREKFSKARLNEKNEEKVKKHKNTRFLMRKVLTNEQKICNISLLKNKRQFGRGVIYLIIELNDKDVDWLVVGVRQLVPLFFVFAIACDLLAAGRIDLEV